MRIDKYLVAFLLIIATSLNSNAQRLEIAFALPTGADQLSNNTGKIIRSKFLPIMTDNGIETTDVSTIAIRPEVSFSNGQVVEGGMKNIHTADVQFNFICTNLMTGTVYASLVMNINGSGLSDDETVKNAANQLSSQDKRLSDFIIKSKDKILEYYSENLNAIISRAQTSANLHQYGEALALLFSCPSTIPSYSRINNQIVSIYRQYQTEECSNIVQKARAEYANGKYVEAAEWLKQVDMTSSCASEAKQLCETIKKSKDADAARIINLIENVSKRQADLEKQRISAARDVAVAYFKQKRSDIYFMW